MSSPRPAPFDEDALLSAARRRTGLDDFGDEPFREPLRVLLASLAEAPLNGVGTLVLRASIRRSLDQRLLANEWLRRHPEIGDEPLRAPWVVVGMMRSGTTLLQRLLARDPRHRAVLGWELGEPAPRPGDDWRPDWSAPDPRIAEGIERSRQLRELAPELHAIHPTDALEADEEIVFLADAFLSHVPEASCHVPAYRAWLDGQDFAPAYRHLRRMLQLLQWQRRRRGEPVGRWVLKTPAHLGYLDTLLAHFPDARVLHVHRTPLETVPSGASLNHTLWRLYADDVDPAEVGRQWLERMAWATRRALAARRELPAERFVDLAYRELLADPLGSLERAYGALGETLEPGARDAMQAWLVAEARAERPRHRYGAEVFGLSETAIREAFGDYLERFAAALR